MLVLVENTDDTFSVCTESVEKIVQVTLTQEKASCDEVSIQFVDKQTISSLHKQFFDDPTETDCITLPIDPPNTKPYCLLGEVFVCPAIGKEYAKQNQLDPWWEITLYTVHGILHLLGYDDIDPEERKKMRAAEQRCLTELKKNNICLLPTQSPGL